MNSMAKYLVKNPKQLLKYINMLADERCLISATFGEDEEDNFSTTIYAIDEKNQTIAIDCDSRLYLNKKLLNCPEIKCSTHYRGIKVEFNLIKIRKSGTQVEPLLKASIPEAFFWIQQREFYRVKSPLSKNSFCTVTLKNQKNQNTALNLKLHNISANGIALLMDSCEFSNQLIPNTSFQNCTLVLENEENQIISFEIRNKILLNPNKPEKIEVIGCRITNCTPRMEAIIFQYMHAIEREHKGI